MSIQSAIIKATSLCLRSREPKTTQEGEHDEEGADDESDMEDDFRVRQEELGNPFRD